MGKLSEGLAYVTFKRVASDKALKISSTPFISSNFD